MASARQDNAVERVKESAFRALDPTRRETTNLAVDARLYEPGEALGPAIQQLTVERPSLLVFADDEPRANFAHPCRYLLFDPQTAEPHAELHARFPPWEARIPQSVEQFHRPFRPVPVEDLFHVRPPFRCPILLPRGNRYAILFSGMSNTRHLNDMEFGYRTLVHRYGFAPENITVLSFDGTTDTQEGSNSTWPGDGTAYQIVVDGAGTQAELEAAIDALKPKLSADDLLFIHTNNHGDNDGTQSYLCTHPSYGAYYADDFSAKLGELPKYRSLMVMMEQCNAGGFGIPIVDASTADATSVASAAIATQSSWGSADGHWDCFARDWFSAMAGHDPYGAALAYDPDTDADGKIVAVEAFGYAETERYIKDSPQFDESGGAGAMIWLGQEYRVWWWWCVILHELLERPYRRWPDPEFYGRLHEIEPELRKLTDSLDRRSAELRKEVQGEVAAIVERAFGGGQGA
jgi:hypothetical protein